MIKTLLALTAFSMVVMTGCTASFSTGNDANSGNATSASNKNSNKPASNTETAKDDGKSKPALKNEKKPEGTAKTAKKDNPVPENWIYVYDEAKGYGFYVPDGTTGASETVDGVDTFVGSTPSPSEIAIVVIAFKDKEMTKDDLLDVAVKFLEQMGEKVTPGDLTAESDEYAVAEATTTSQDGTKGKAKILVGTDITDNYVMLLGTEESKFAANEKIIDEIWGSFEMWSQAN
ncbi:MAG: hypothetical protein KIS76_10290 [Pyrinomonadaceae bacterium]|nr:hypothetical protein [Pyrinomonadaceae bacterium]